MKRGKTTITVHKWIHTDDQSLWCKQNDQKDSERINWHQQTQLVWCGALLYKNYTNTASSEKDLRAYRFIREDVLWKSSNQNGDRYYGFMLKTAIRQNYPPDCFFHMSDSQTVQLYQCVSSNSEHSSHDSPWQIWTLTHTYTATKRNWLVC